MQTQFTKLQVFLTDLPDSVRLMSCNKLHVCKSVVYSTDMPEVMNQYHISTLEHVDTKHFYYFNIRVFV